MEELQELFVLKDISAFSTEATLTQEENVSKTRKDPKGSVEILVIVLISVTLVGGLGYWVYKNKQYDQPSVNQPKSA